jgi:hypothetical protein
VGLLPVKDAELDEVGAAWHALLVFPLAERDGVAVPEHSGDAPLRVPRLSADYLQSIRIFSMSVIHNYKIAIAFIIQ